MPFDFQQFVNPAQFSDLGYITGFDPKTGIQPAVPKGAVAPESVTDYAQQAIAPTMAKFEAAKTILGQASSGDIKGAYNTYKQGSANTGFDFSSSPH